MDLPSELGDNDGGGGRGLVNPHNLGLLNEKVIQELTATTA